jgi:hypothetical protein
MTIIVVRKAEPGTIKKKISQTLRGKPTRTGDRLSVTQSPTVWVANSNVKSRACLRVNSIVTSLIVARVNVIPSRSAAEKETFFNKRLGLGFQDQARPNNPRRALFSSW